MLWYDSLKAKRTGTPQQGRDLLLKLVKDLEDTREIYKGYAYVRTIRNILIGKKDAAIAPFFEGKPYYGQFENLSLERVEHMMDALVSSYQLDVIHTDHGKLYVTRESSYDDLVYSQQEKNVGNDSVVAKDLKSLLKKEPHAWKHINEFRAALLDLYPGDKIKRNLIFHCVEEGIPEDLLSHDRVDDFMVNALCDRLLTAVGCERDTAKNIILLWADALEIETPEESLEEAKKLYILANKYESDNDLSKAFNCYVDAANKGSADAASFLAVAYEEKWLGLEYDQRLASIWHLRAAELGNVASQCEIAKRYFYGIGIEEDEEQAKKWLDIADKNYNEETEDCTQEMIDCAYYIWFNQKKNFNYLDYYSFTWACDDCDEGLDAFEVAVDDGYLGNYSEIGNFLYHGGDPTHLANIKVRQSTDEAYTWYERFYDDYSNGRLELHLVEGVVEALFNYGYLSIVNNIYDFDFDKAIAPWKDAIEFAEDSDPKEMDGYIGWDRQYLYQIGRIFYDGIIPGGNEEGVLCKFDPDVEMAYRAFIQAKRHGYEKAQEYLDKMHNPFDEEDFELPFN